MSANKAQEIIKRAMSDRSVYDAMAARENEVWIKIVSGLGQSEATIEAAKGSAQLVFAEFVGVTPEVVRACPSHTGRTCHKSVEQRCSR